MEINHKAPVQAEATIVIAAEPAKIWNILVNVRRWPEWNSDVRSVVFDGRVEISSVFRWTIRSGTITSTFRQIEPPHRLVWTGDTWGINAVHTWTLESGADGKTTVHTAESFEGILPRLLRRPLKAILFSSLTRTLQALKTAAEAQARPTEAV